MRKPIVDYLLNPALPVLKNGWKGNPVDADRRFIHPEYPFWPEFSMVWKMMTGHNPQKEEKKKETFQLETQYPEAFFNSQEDGIIWLGHATFVIRLSGLTLITDPVFGSPSMLMKRHSPLPFDPALLTGIDFILQSHDHRDHLDNKSMKLLLRNNPGVRILTGLGMKEILESWGAADVCEAGWYQRYDVQAPLEVDYLPARHWARRGLFDTNKRLWGSFIIRSGDKIIYFAADSGYGNHFSEIGRMFPGIGYSMIGIGAYKPSWFMSPIHTSPAEALKAASDLGAQNFIPMHYGAFDLSQELLSDPYNEVQKEYSKSEYRSRLLLLRPGEFWKV